jgi:hypothetical protein
MKMKMMMMMMLLRYCEKGEANHLSQSFIKNERGSYTLTKLHTTQRRMKEQGDALKQSTLKNLF